VTSHVSVIRCSWPSERNLCGLKRFRCDRDARIEGCDFIPKNNCYGATQVSCLQVLRTMLVITHRGDHVTIHAHTLLCRHESPQRGLVAGNQRGAFQFNDLQFPKFRQGAGYRFPTCTDDLADFVVCQG